MNTNNSNEENGIYGNVIHQGITIADWCKIFKNEFTQYELYKIIMEGGNLRKLSSVNDIV